MMNTKRTEGKVQSLCREVTNDVGGVTAPEGDETLVTVGAGEAVYDTLVRLRKTALLDLNGGDVKMRTLNIEQ